MEDRPVYVIEPREGKLLDFRELWQYRELFYFFTWRDIKIKYKETVLGVAWVALQPLLSVAILTVVLSKLLRVDTPLPYPVFAFSGFMFWTLFAAGVSNAGNSMISNAAIIKKIYFPRIIIPVSVILVCFVDFCITFLLFIPFLIYYRSEITIDFAAVAVLWPLAVLLALLATLAISSWLAALNVKYRDFRYVIPFILQIGLFVTPVMYPVSVIGNPWVAKILALNPLYAPIKLFRAPMMDQPVWTGEVWISLASTLIFFLFGVYYFRKTEAYFADLA